MSLYIATKKSSTNSANPTMEICSNTRSEMLRPRMRSMMLKSTCPPSSGSRGSMLRMARLTLISASSIR